MKKIAVFLPVILVLLSAGCSKFEAEQLSLKDSFDRSINNINDAVSVISSTKGYELLSSASTEMKSDLDFRDSITLDLVAGIYDFKPNLKHHHNFFIPFRLFEKTGESDHLIVNMPEKHAFRPWCLYNPSAPDSILKNNFTIDASEYHYYYTWFNRHDYGLKADFTLDTVDIGNLEVLSESNREDGYSRSSKYTFEEGYNIAVSYETGDSTISSFNLSQDEEILMAETSIWIRDDHHKREKVYILTIGNIDIIRGSKLDSIQVYLDGVLQKEAGVIITDEDDDEWSVCRHRDILLTFDDGTTANLSDLIAPAKEVMATIVGSLRNMNFAKRVVDYIAISIYYHSYFINL